ncbi:MAG TPA: isocitrate lyase/PEP mutase family protein [Miltoncostaeaceae bacterium]|nr:isocitrate lyase/PEP mutase family protein [Miltoncostaeaceae bacterium]
MSGAARIRALLADGPVVVPGVYDGLSARLAVAAGAPVVFVSGFAVAAARLGLPDIGYLTPTEMAQTAREVCAAVPGVPVLVDADTGYGDALSARRVARELHAAGAAGLMLEDQVWPKRCGHMDGKRVVEAGEWLAKLRAVRDLRDEGADLFLIARTDARAPLSLDEAIARARAAHDLGADAVFVEAPADAGEMRRVTAGTPGAVRMANMVEGGRTPLMTPAELHDAGHDLVARPLTGLLAAARALAAAYGALAGGPPGAPPGMLDFAAMTALLDLEGHRRTGARY